MFKIDNSVGVKLLQNKYFPPSMGAEKFHCPHCAVFAHQIWSSTYRFIGSGYRSIKPLSTSLCSHCDQFCYWHEDDLVYPPESPVEFTHPDLPSDCIAEYEEARKIVSSSPRSAAALLRLCIQKLMPHLGESGKNINDDIKSLVSKGLPLQLQQALDICRVVGNNAVHPGEININDSPEIAHQLFRMINIIVEERITRPREIDAIYNQLPANSRAAIEQRDGKSD